MVKLDPSLIRFFEDEDFRVLTALEMTTRNHEVAPVVLIERIAQLPHGGCRKRLRMLLKHKVIHHENTAYDGYAMKYSAFDFLALRTLAKRGSVTGVGSRIGCGKESDIFLIEDEHGQQAVLKLQRLGRCSFRSVARNRDYKNGKARRGASWFYLSRLAATKEFAFMKMLYDEGFPVPKPIDHNRHAVVMEFAKGTLLNRVLCDHLTTEQAQKVYHRCVSLVVKLAQHGLIHGDFNEFNAFVTPDHRIILIDFPQMVSTDHPNAVELFNRDIQNLADFFQRRFKVSELLYPSLTKDIERVGELDKQAMASGFSKQDQRQMELLMAQEAERKPNGEDEEEDSDEEDDGAVDDAVTSKEKLFAMKEAEGIASSLADELPEDYDEEEGEESESPKKGDENEEEEEEEGEEEESSESEGEVERQARRRERATTNPNVKRGGKLNIDHIKQRVKAKAQFQENRDFNQNMHRNMSKGYEKQSLKRRMKNVKDAQSANDYV